MIITRIILKRLDPILTCELSIPAPRDDLFGHESKSKVRRNKANIHELRGNDNDDYDYGSRNSGTR
jgi:hypothetical protein